MRVESANDGYVKLREVQGNALSVVNAARVSFEKASTELNDKDRRLLAYLARNGHWSPFAHARITLEFKQPLMVARQVFRHMVGAAAIEEGQVWNEASRRYVQEPPDWYTPREWRAAPTDGAKQGSKGRVESQLEATLHARLQEIQAQLTDYYLLSVQAGVAAEQARLFLPAYGMQVRWIWSPSWQTLYRFWKERLDHHAQREIQDLAHGVDRLAFHADAVLYETLATEL